MGLSNAVASLFDLITLLLFISILLTWVPNINWYNEPFRSLRAFSEFFFAPFRKIIPPVGMLDLSPIVAFFALNILGGIITALLKEFGL